MNQRPPKRPLIATRRILASGTAGATATMIAVSTIIADHLVQPMNNPLEESAHFFSFSAYLLMKRQNKGSALPFSW